MKLLNWVMHEWAADWAATALPRFVCALVCTTCSISQGFSDGPGSPVDPAVWILRETLNPKSP